MAAQANAEQAVRDMLRAVVQRVRAQQVESASVGATDRENVANAADQQPNKPSAADAESQPPQPLALIANDCMDDGARIALRVSIDPTRVCFILYSYLFPNQFSSMSLYPLLVI